MGIHEIGGSFIKEFASAYDIAKGRRFFKTVLYSGGCKDSDGEYDADDLESMVQIAVKKAELMNLTKEERNAIGGPAFSDRKIFLLVFVFMGGLFGFFMTLAFVLITSLVCLLAAQPQSIPSILADMPWGILLLTTWVLFGGITVLSKRK